MNTHGATVNRGEIVSMYAGLKTNYHRPSMLSMTPLTYVEFTSRYERQCQCSARVDSYDI